MHRGNPLASIRFRLTAWYAAMLALVLVLLAVAVLQLAENRLQADMDSRLLNTADDIAGVIGESLASLPPVPADVALEAAVPGLGSFSSRGLLVQILDRSGEVIRRSEAAPQDPMMALPPAAGEIGVVRRTERVGDWTVRAVEYPLVLTGGGPDSLVGAVLVGERTETMEQTLRSLRQVLLATSLGGLLVATAVGWLLADRALRPVDRMTAAAAAIAGDGGVPSLAARVPQPGGSDEMARLASTFNAMLDRIAAAFATQRRFVADASHELRTPLAAIRGNVDVLARQIAALPADAPHRNDLVDAAADIRAESARMGRLLDDLLLLARTDASNAGAGPSALREPLEPTDLTDVARAAVRTAGGLASGQSLREDLTPATALGDRDRLLQVTLALLDNALRHTPPGGTVTVSTGERPDGDAFIRVSDDGAGIDPAHLPHLFDRFYRADEARGRAQGGAGLGLAIARAIARAHGGDIAVESSPGAGAAFTVLLPAAPVAPAGSVAQEADHAVRT